LLSRKLALLASQTRDRILESKQRNAASAILSCSVNRPLLTLTFVSQRGELGIVVAEEAGLGGAARTSEIRA